MTYLQNSILELIKKPQSRNINSQPQIQTHTTYAIALADSADGKVEVEFISTAGTDLAPQDVVPDDVVIVDTTQDVASANDTAIAEYEPVEFELPESATKTNGITFYPHDGEMYVTGRPTANAFFTFASIPLEAGETIVYGGIPQTLNQNGVVSYRIYIAGYSSVATYDNGLGATFTADTSKTYNIRIARYTTGTADEIITIKPYIYKVPDSILEYESGSSEDE